MALAPCKPANKSCSRSRINTRILLHKKTAETALHPAGFALASFLPLKIAIKGLFPTILVGKKENNSLNQWLYFDRHLPLGVYKTSCRKREMDNK
jgi:hypothetical protein